MLRRGRDVHDENEDRDTPSAVVWAVATGTAPLPFLAVYAVMFIVHGGIHPVVPPDITDSTRGELIAGILALVLFVVAVVALLWMLNGRRRWPFVLVQLGMLATAVDFFVDVTKGGRTTSLVVAVAAVIALVCAFTPAAWEHVGRSRPRLRRPARQRGGPQDLTHEAGGAPDLVPFAEEDEPSRDPQSV
jgi:hypothetical protein